MIHERVPIRVADESDLPFLMTLAREKYPHRGGGDTSVRWLRWVMNDRNHLVLVGAHSGGIASVSWNYGIERRGRVDVLAARPTPGAALEAMRMVRLMVDWARQEGAESFRLAADTNVDFAPFAARLGAVPKAVVHYEFDLRQEARHG